MRKRLFRGFHPCSDGTEKVFINEKWISGKWVYGDLIHRTIWAQAALFIRTEDNGFDNYKEFEVISVTIGEFTGITVKGKQLFEGDICNDTAVIGVITWHNDNCGFYIVNKHGCFTCYKYVAGEAWTIIGNIYESPDLLEV